MMSEVVIRHLAAFLAARLGGLGPAREDKEFTEPIDAKERTERIW